MEEDIKILEEFYTKGYPMMYIKYGGGIKANSKIQRTLENLIKGYKELEEENERLYEREKYLEQRRTDIINKFQNETTDTTIPKSKIQEKIEEVNKSLGYSPVNKILIEQVLQELLEDK